MTVPIPSNVSEFLIGGMCIHYAGDKDCRYFCRIVLKDGTNRGRTIHETAIARLLEVIPAWRVSMRGDASRFHFCAAESVPDAETLLIQFFQFGPTFPWLV
jgi:hypothetical protein